MYVCTLAIFNVEYIGYDTSPILGSGSKSKVLGYAINLPIIWPCHGPQYCLGLHASPFYLFSSDWGTFLPQILEWTPDIPHVVRSKSNDFFKK